MKAVQFDYFRAETMDEALTLLESFKEDAKVLCGGQSLIPVLNMRLARPKVVVDINKIKELNELGTEGKYVKIGAVIRHNEVEHSSLVKEQLPLLAKALPHIGHSQIRNRGTLVGSIVHADPSAEVPLISLLLDAHLEVRSKDNQRMIPISEFYYGYMMTDLQPDEIVTSVKFPITSPPKGGKRGTEFVEVARREGDFALVEAACQIDIDENGKIFDVRLGLGGVGPAPIKLEEVEDFLKGKEPTNDLFESVSQMITDYLEPDEDPFVPEEYRKSVAKRFIFKVLDGALKDALQIKEESSR
ncbi:FAD binding domain-containing protein [Bacillus sp. Marseille-P3661]|uniref:FAD binding domain-containing protein n=1 Tax=Bacillus sp. Marseille-P3661 TaxID=1936234 RepID=UPI000C8444C0|nr:xanthine dehydrogenase family protein subunit M [Bacillus sp. Marseille-P3661]